MKPLKTKQQTGFTIVELLIVIVVIGILASITIVAYGGIQDRAKTTVVMSELKSTEKALGIFATFEGWSSWPDDASLPGDGTINDLIAAHPGLEDSLTAAPEGIDGQDDWIYDNDMDSKDMPCGPASDLGDGVNISVDVDGRALDPDIMAALDAQIDDSDGHLCGKFRYLTTAEQSDPDNFYYNISLDGSVH